MAFSLIGGMEDGSGSSRISLTQKNRLKPGFSGLQNHSGSSENNVSLVPETGIEPATFALRVRCSTG
jgi:hypothetical protein